MPMPGANFPELRKAEVRARGRAGKAERPWQSYGRLLLFLLYQLLEGHAVCPSDLRHGRQVGLSLAGLQADQGPVSYVCKLGRLLLRKTPLLPKEPKLQRDRFRHRCSSRSEGRSSV